MFWEVRLAQIVFDYDGDALEVTAERGAFRGTAKITDAYEPHFPTTEFSLFLNELKVFPLRNPAFSVSRVGEVELEAYKTDALGHLELRVKLGDCLSKSSLEIFMKLDYESANLLARELRKLVIDHRFGRFTFTTED